MANVIKEFITSSDLTEEGVENMDIRVTLWSDNELSLYQGEATEGIYLTLDDLKNLIAQAELEVSNGLR
tara:strand:+ start:93 stop:299 length:207 start_codon:yes stop_codon:yes gene_type:complete